jgi:hypothetical protein
MYEGRITGFRDPDVPAAELGRLMAGGADGGHALELGPLPEMDGTATPGSATTTATPQATEAPGTTQATEAPADADATDSQEES